MTRWVAPFLLGFFRRELRRLVRALLERTRSRGMPLYVRTRCTVVWCRPSWEEMVPTGHFSALEAPKNLRLEVLRDHGESPTVRVSRRASAAMAKRALDGASDRPDARERGQRAPAKRARKRPASGWGWNGDGIGNGLLDRAFGRGVRRWR